MKRVTLLGSNWDWLSWQSVLVALTLLQGYVLIGSTYLIWKTTDELQATHYKTAKLPLDNAAWCDHDFTPIFYESARSFVPATACLYLWYYPRAGMLLTWRLFTSLDRKENALLSSGQFLFVLTFIGLALVVFPYIILLKSPFMKHLLTPVRS